MLRRCNIAICVHIGGSVVHPYTLFYIWDRERCPAHCGVPQGVIVSGLKYMQSFVTDTSTRLAPVNPSSVQGQTDTTVTAAQSGVGCPTRSRHFLRRYFALRQRMESEEIVLKHVKDENQPADFLTKWITPG